LSAPPILFHGPKGRYAPIPDQHPGIFQAKEITEALALQGATLGPYPGQLANMVNKQGFHGKVLFFVNILLLGDLLPVFFIQA
jgi:hypothetical protein